jgi:hypothetical protein
VLAKRSVCCDQSVKSRNEILLSVMPACGFFSFDVDDAFGVRKRKRTEENAVHQAKDRGVRADAERERNDGDGGEAFVLQQHAESVADVVQEGCHPQFTWVSAIMESARVARSAGM